MSISLSNGVRQALTSIQATSSAAQVAQNRLATGKKVNSALDNPASFFVSAGLNNRANDLSRLLDDQGQAVKTLEAADKGIKALQKLVETAQGTARQAQQSTAINLTKTGTADLSAYTAVAGDAGTVRFVVDGVNKDLTIATGDTGSGLVDKVNALGGLKAELDT